MAGSGHAGQFGVATRYFVEALSAHQEEQGWKWLNTLDACVPYPSS